MDKPDISIIIPVYNEAKHLDKLFSNIEFLRDKCEIIFVDGGSYDGTQDGILERGGNVIVAPQKGRANQMNYGAKNSTGDILWFLHADSVVPAMSFDQIQDVLDAGYKIGCFPIEFDSSHLFMTIHAWLSNFRVQSRSVAFGDAGIFLTRALFEELGGYADIPLMEDYQLSIDIKKLGLTIGMTKEKIITSQRRYIKNGPLKTMWKMQVLQHQFRQGHDIQKIANSYNE